MPTSGGTRCPLRELPDALGDSAFAFAAWSFGALELCSGGWHCSERIACRGSVAPLGPRFGGHWEVVK